MKRSTRPGRVSGTDLASPDVVRYAGAFGGVGVRVEHNADITDGIREVFDQPGVGILEIAVAEDTIAVGQSLERLQGPNRR